MNLTRNYLFALAATLVVLLSIGCSGRNPTELSVSAGNTDPVVFSDPPENDAFDVYWQPFFETNYTGLAIDSVYAYGDFQFYGARSLKFNVPPAASALGLYLGGVITGIGPRNLTDYNALTFYVRANQEVVGAQIKLDLAGFGNDNTGTSLYEAGTSGLALTTAWKKIVLPIPRPDRLISERGLFTIAEGLELTNGDVGPAKLPAGYDIWVDEIVYEKVDGITNPRPAMASSQGNKYFVGSTIVGSDTRTTFAVDGRDITMNHMPGYFDFVSSDPTVAVPVTGGVKIIGVGEVDITANLVHTPGDTIAVEGAIAATGIMGPLGPAPAPTYPDGDVVSLFSDVYDDRPVLTWRAEWSPPGTEHSFFAIDGDQMHLYTLPSYNGILLAEKIDVSDMTAFHMDLFAPFGTQFFVKLAARVEGNARPTESQEIALNADTTPAFVAGEWSSIEIPMSDFVFTGTIENPTTTLAELVIRTTDANLVLIDNIYFHK